jgi:protein-L-isoaspartate(D-aspartate) O-methyltransferase
VPRDWVDRQLRRRGIGDPRVLEAMRTVPREAFVPDDAVDRAYADAALELSHGQTISQPYVVALICEALELTGGERVLDVGTGSGYQAAVLDELAAEVVSVERIPELAEQARSNLAATGHERVEVRVGDGSLGVPDRAPFGAIAVAAAAGEIPPALVDQLEPGGRLVLPVGDSLVRARRLGRGLVVEPLAPVRFVPLVTGLPSGGAGDDRRS